MNTEKTDARLRTTTRALVILALIPIVLHLWMQMFDWMDITLLRGWDLFEIDNAVTPP